MDRIHDLHTLSAKVDAFYEDRPSIHGRLIRYESRSCALEIGRWLVGEEPSGVYTGTSSVGRVCRRVVVGRAVCKEIQRIEPIMCGGAKH